MLAPARTCGGVSELSSQDYSLRESGMTTHRILFALLFLTAASTAPLVASAYYLPTLPTPTQNYYQYNIRPAQPPSVPTLVPRPVEPLKPLAPIYTPSVPSYAPTYYRYYNPYRPSIYSPYSGSNVSDYVNGLKKPLFITY